MFHYDIQAFRSVALAVRREGQPAFERYRREVETKTTEALKRLVLVLRALSVRTGIDFASASVKALELLNEATDDDNPLAKFPEVFKASSVFVPSGPLFTLRNNMALLLSEEVQDLLREVSRVRRYIWRHVEHLTKLANGAAVHLGILDPATDLNRLIEKAIQLERERHSIDFRIIEVRQVGRTLPSFCADHTRLMIALRELIRNAAFATQTTVDRSTRAPVRSSSVVTIETKELGPRLLQVVIEDNGIGISPETLPHVRKYGYTTAQDEVTFGGLGIGIPTAIDSILELGGLVDYESDRSWGTRVTLAVPVPDVPVQ